MGKKCIRKLKLTYEFYVLKKVNEWETMLVRQPQHDIKEYDGDTDIADQIVQLTFDAKKRGVQLICKYRTPAGDVGPVYVTKTGISPMMEKALPEDVWEPLAKSDARIVVRIPLNRYTGAVTFHLPGLDTYSDRPLNVNDVIDCICNDLRKELFMTKNILKLGLKAFEEDTATSDT